eukprot:XP_001609163.1 variant erythrocyte surface antigen-1, alpha subunit [Babesia bovis T2Bo]
MALKNAFTPKASLTDAPTNLKEAIDWVLRVTGKDGNNNNGECICGLAAAVTDLLQSVELQYHGYQGDSNGSGKGGPPKKRVTECLNGLFSLVQGLGGTAVVRTYMDQLAQVLSALVGWSKIDKCWGSGDSEKCKGGGSSNEHGEKTGCEYLQDVKHENKCGDCGCMKWNVTNADNEGTPLGRKCTRCSDSGDSAHRCSCNTGGSSTCTAESCQCYKKGKCCKCYCKGKGCGCKDAKCSCDKEMKDEDSYLSAYRKRNTSWVDGGIRATWLNLEEVPYSGYPVTPSQRRHHCARILLGSVCLIWSGLTYMYWTGKYHKGSPRWNNHILDGSGMDDGTLSQWLQALGFPREMLNNHGPGNRLDAIIWDGIRGMLYLGFPHTSYNAAHGSDHDDNTFRQPAGMNYAGYIHTVDRGAFDSSVFKGTGDTKIDKNKQGALFKLYILSCAYFTGLQKKTNTQTTTSTTPRTIREILYWLSALPYSPAYKDMLDYAKERLKKEAPDVGGKRQLSFYQQGRNAPITVDEYNLFAHFQAVTQYCPLVLIGIQGGLHSTKGTDKTTEPPIHSLYANTECHFTYPEVKIQAYNQVVHYIRALFYQLYFLRKQCAVKVALGGKWRECRYGNGVVSKGVISWMCLGCNPMEHDRKKRVDKVKEGLVGVKESDKLAGGLKTLLEKIGEVVVQLGNAQEELEKSGGNVNIALAAVKKVSGVNGSDLKGVLEKVIEVVQEVVEKLVEGVKEKVKALEEIKKTLEAAKEKLEEAKKTQEALEAAKGELEGAKGALTTAKKAFPGSSSDIDPCKNIVSATIDGLHKALQLLKDAVQQIMEATRKDTTEFQDAIFSATYTADVVTEVEKHQAKQKVTLDALSTLVSAIEDLLSICNTPKCPGCTKHSDKCGQPPKPTVCQTCLQPTTTGVPSPLQAFLEDRLPGFSCKEVPDTENPEYPPAASHLRHCGGSGQCCPLPMGFRGQFHEGSIRDCTGQRLYGILYFFSNENMMQSCVYTLVRVTAALSATTPQVLGDVFGFFRGGVGNKERGKPQKGEETSCEHTGNPSESSEANKSKYFCGWCASGLREEVKKIEWIQKITGGDDYRESVGKALRDIKGSDSTATTTAYSSTGTTTTSLSALTKDSEYLSPLTGELYTAVSATFGNTYLSWVLYLSDALHWGLQSLSEAFQQIECRGCKGQCDPNKCKKGSHGGTDSAQCNCSSIVSCTGVLPVLYRHGFSYGNPFNLEGYQQKEKDEGDYSITDTKSTKKCHQFLDSLSAVINKKKESDQKDQDNHPLTNLLSQVGKLQYDIRLPWIFVLTIAWLVAVLYLAFGAIWPLDWTHMRSHWLRGGEHQWQCMWYKVMTGRKGMELVEYFGRR